MPPRTSDKALRAELDKALEPGRRKGRVIDLDDGEDESTPITMTPATTAPVIVEPPVKETSPPLSLEAGVDLTPAVTVTPAAAKRGYLRLPNEIIDNVLPSLRPSEQAVFLRLYRQSHGFSKPSCLISLPRLALLCHLSESQARRAVRVLEGRGYVKQLRIEQGARERGIVFEVYTPVEVTGVKVAPVVVAPVSVTPNKKNNKENLKSGGYECSRCKDTGFWYPDGVSQGVVRCKHD